MRIGELSTRTGTSVRALRHYDRHGLLTPGRSDNRYRVFEEADVDRVRLIRLFLGVGFTLEEIRAYAPCFRNGLPPDASVHVEEVLALYRRRLAEVDAHLDALSQLRARLAAQVVQLERQAETSPALTLSAR